MLQYIKIILRYNRNIIIIIIIIISRYSRDGWERKSIKWGGGGWNVTRELTNHFFRRINTTANLGAHNLNSVSNSPTINQNKLYSYSFHLSNDNSFKPHCYRTSQTYPLYPHSNDLIDHLISDESRSTSTISWVRCGTD